MENKDSGTSRLLMAGCPYFYVDETGSTNDLALQDWENTHRAPAVFHTGEQTAGRGRFDRVWMSRRGASLTFSLLVAPECEPASFPMLTLVCALAVCDAIRSFGKTQPGIKWPNDIVFSGRKVCGILTQMTPDRRAAVIGAGVNLTKESYPKELAGRAVSLEEILLSVPDAKELLSSIVRAFFERLGSFLKTGDMSLLRKDYCELLINTGKRVRMTEGNEEIAGTALGIDNAGRLIFQKDDGQTISVHSGEVSVQGVYGGGL